MDIHRCDERELRRFVRELFTAAGVGEESALRASDVFVRASLRGYGHHDIADLPSRLRALTDGTIEPRAAEPVAVHQFGAVEQFDGHNALGEVCASVVMERACHLAGSYGIGLAVVSKSNHFLAAAPYVQQAAEAGLLGIIVTRTFPSMGTPGSGKLVIGNNPIGVGAPVAGAADFVLDISLAYASWGRLAQLADSGTKIPAHWGTGPDGQPTTDPAVALAGAAEPIGGHKGVALALVAEILTSVLSDGVLSDERARDGNRGGVHSQAAIAIDPGATVGRGRAARRTADLFASTAELAGPTFRYPGQRSAGSARQARLGGIPISKRLSDDLNGWATRLRVAPLRSRE
jgi:LDH2 family malate/lactate/ureidoglycolate dehydrogenase